MSSYYNENDPNAADWIELLIKEGLIPDGSVDRRSIADVTAKDVEGFGHVHWFAGIAGWAHALRRAGYPDDRAIWTGSCPCQPFSAAGLQKGIEDERHLWPEMFRLIKECGPGIIIGEQVASSDVVGTQLEADFTVAVQSGDFAKANKLAKRLVASSSFHFHRRWLDGIRTDLEAANHSFRCVVLGAHSVNSPNIRQRLFWLANASSERARRNARAAFGTQAGGSGSRDSNGMHGGNVPESCGPTDGLANSGQQPSRVNDAGQSLGAGDEPHKRGSEEIGESGRCGGIGVNRLANGDSERLARRTESHGIEERHGLETSRRTDAGGRSDSDRMEHPASDGRFERRSESIRGSVASGCGADGVGDSLDSRPQGLAGDVGDGNQSRWIDSIKAGPVAASSAWSDYRIIPCRDGKYRRISVESGDEPLADGIPSSVVPIVAELERMGFSPKDVKRLKGLASQLLAKARRNRVIRLKGYGNAINDVVAAEFIKAFMSMAG